MSDRTSTLRKHGPPLRGAVLLGLALIATLGSALAGCDAAQPEEPGTLVVEAFFRAEEPLDTLDLRQTLPPGAARGAGPATGADVRLTLDGRPVPYRAAGSPGRYAPAERGITASTGASFALRVDWNGQSATGSGRIPPPIRLDTAVVRVPPQPVRTVLVDSLRLDSLDVPAEQGYIYPVEVELRWTAPAAGTDDHWIQARLRPFASFSSGVIDFFLQPEATFREQAAVSSPCGTGRRRCWQGVYAVPAAGADAPLPPHRLRVGLVRADSAYARFARTQNDPDQREPDGNVRGALGIAAGVAVDERTLDVSD